MTAPARVLRAGPLSLRWRSRTAAAGTAGLAGLLALAVLSLTRGDVVLAPGEVLAVLGGGGDAVERFVVAELRLPRLLAGVLAGLALGLSGALSQSVTRNPLASPDVLGVTGGAGLAAVAVLTLGGSGGVESPSWTTTWLAVPLAALAGGLLTAAVVYTLAWRAGVDGQRLLLVGIGIGALCTAGTSWLLVRAEIRDAGRALAWLTGSLNGRGWEHAVPLAVAVVLGLAGVVAAHRTLSALRYGEDTALALGVRLQAGRAVLVVLAVLLAAVATAAAGPVAFVALLAPQAALRIARTAGPPPLLSALAGAAVLVAADLVARTVLPVEVPAGVVTAAVGAPLLLVLLVSSARKVTR